MDAEQQPQQPQEMSPEMQQAVMSAMITQNVLISLARLLPDNKIFIPEAIITEAAHWMVNIRPDENAGGFHVEVVPAPQPKAPELVMVEPKEGEEKRLERTMPDGSKVTLIGDNWNESDLIPAYKPPVVN